MIKNITYLIAIIVIGLFAFGQMTEKDMSVSDILKASDIIFDSALAEEERKRTLDEKYRDAEKLTKKMMQTGDFSDYETLLRNSDAKINDL